MKVTKSGLVVAGAAIVLIASGFAYATEKDMKNVNKETMKQEKHEEKREEKHEKHEKHHEKHRDGKHEKHHKHEKHEKHEKHHEKGDPMKKDIPNTQQPGMGTTGTSSSTSGSSH